VILYDLSALLTADLASRKFPFAVEYSQLRLNCPERGTRIIMGPDLRQRDTLSLTNAGAQRRVPGAGASAGEVAARSTVLGVAGVVTIFAQSAADGATEASHLGAAHELAAAVISGLYHVGRAQQRIIEVQDAGLEDSDPYAPTRGERWPGVVYTVRFRCPRAVHRLDYLGAGEPRIQIAIVATSTSGGHALNDLQTDLAINVADAPPLPQENP
jgi:hypothetical protein